MSETERSKPYEAIKRLPGALFKLVVLMPLNVLALLIIMGIGLVRDRKPKREQGRFEA